MTNKSRFVFILCFLAYTFLSGCAGCSQSGLNHATEKHKAEPQEPFKGEIEKRTVVKMTKVDGVFQIPVMINGIEMYFIFDTGAGLISISETEATFLYKQGRLSEDDILGTANFINAQGDISEGTIILLEKVKIGDRTLTGIEASVVHNLYAPLLFGQSALEKFGKVSIDYTKNEIMFE
jgi:aspartyl protease family protein